MPDNMGNHQGHRASAPALSALQMGWLLELGLERRFLQPLARRAVVAGGAADRAPDGGVAPVTDGAGAAAHDAVVAVHQPAQDGAGPHAQALLAAGAAGKTAGPGPSALAREMLSSLRAATGGDAARGRRGGMADSTTMPPVPVFDPGQARQPAAAPAAAGQQASRGWDSPSQVPAASSSPDGAQPTDASRLPAEAPQLSDASQVGLHGLQTAVLACQACALHAGRAQPVMGEGASETPAWLVIGEAPGALDDRAGLPFQGKTGVLLRAMLAAVGGDLQSQVFYTNAVKCRPLSNRPPQPEEVAQCQAHLRRQIALLQPARILTLGRVAASALLGQVDQWEALRGGVRSYACESGRQIPVIVTYHPGWLLSHPQHKAMAWRDLLLARDLASSPTTGQSTSLGL